ncbi:hypothetical protein SDRG_09205 [Saprolegnia diclina VS20]|uniref:Carbohydrate-binding domain-containing protein n=1 Tax=Saprolegnia diclina (strain VS20) TaxID=1156394 RepID=T0QEP6_SAPDV|nr:hypothetical protein SDRG_09205 [Saprolegnia diclina VS20]EQC33221.1 hypothetical protein SDRG_09205 [Saprolegnia diclina VS20]|eukprot:XP_008613344.1 hypothetical protein SDRG_09205 [Saprolegnia diclina VS20]
MVAFRLLMLAAVVAGAVPSACTFESSYPRRYAVQHLDGAVLDVDGQLDDAGWANVPWSEPFVDIRGETFAAPWFQTRIKMRYDDGFLYVGAHMEETEVWANVTTRNEVIFYDNDFEMFVDATGSTHNYKEFEMNAINTTWNLLLNKPYRDNGHENSTRVDPRFGFDLLPFGLRSGVYMKGSPNHPNQRLKYWTAEVALPLAGLVAGTTARVPPTDHSFWRINFSRVEYIVQIVDGHYEKIPGLSEDNWVWSPQGQIAMHMPEKWGYIQFQRHSPLSPVPMDPAWPVRYLAFQVYYAQAAYVAAHAVYASSLTQLTPYFGSSHDVLACIELTLQLSGHGYEAVVASRKATESVARITHEGYLTVT